MPNSVFISYSSTNEAGATDLQQQLKAAGFTAWRDKTNLRGGDGWPKALGEAIRDYDVFAHLRIVE